jgi:hypothetical protein
MSLVVGNSLEFEWNQQKTEPSAVGVKAFRAQMKLQKSKAKAAPNSKAEL